MSTEPQTDVAAELKKLDVKSPLYAMQFVERLLTAAQEAGVSDVHLQPTPQGIFVRWRIDGVLQPLGEFSRGTAADVVSRLKVMAELLTYRTDSPQEGRIRAIDSVEMRVSTFPTLHGERAVVRLFAAESRYLYLSDLGLPADIETALASVIGETSGTVLITGPAGSGKTTTAYACLREIMRSSAAQRSIVTLEDPIEAALPGVSQSQVQPAAGFTLAAGLRSLMRQDPEVILVGEIRDAETTQTVFQAALTGHLVISTMHAGSAAGAVSRLLDMGVEPYLPTSGLRAVLNQRLVRKLCGCTGGCDACRHTVYRGRLALAEMLPPFGGELRQAILDRRDTSELACVAAKSGMVSLGDRAAAAIEANQTNAAEVRRVFGFSGEKGPGGC
jgi:general secretion pathway protein E